MLYRAIFALSNEDRFEFMLTLLDKGRICRPDWLPKKHLDKLAEGGLIVTKGMIFWVGHDPNDDFVEATPYGIGLTRAIFDFEYKHWRDLAERLDCHEQEQGKD